MKKKILVTFGRFQPPTKAHEAMFHEMRNDAAWIPCDYKIFPSVKSGNAKNPLTFDRKLHYLKAFFPDHNFSTDETIKDPFEMLIRLADAGYEDVILMTGAGRMDDYIRFKDYVGEDREIKLKSYKVANFGEKCRYADTEEIARVSATKMRQAVIDLDVSAFMACAPAEALATPLCELFAELRGTLGMLGAIPNPFACAHDGK